MPENANEHNNVVTLIGELISKVSDWDGVLPVCLTIIGVVMWGVIAVCLCSTQSMLDKYIYLLIYGFFITIIFLFLIPISEKFFVYKLYEAINKQEANRQSVVVQIAKTAIEQLSSKDLSKEDINGLIYTINDCLNNDRGLKERLIKMLKISQKCFKASLRNNEKVKGPALKLFDAIETYLHNPQKDNEEKLKTDIEILIKLSKECSDDLK